MQVMSSLCMVWLFYIFMGIIILSWNMYDGVYERVWSWVIYEEDVGDHV